MLAARVSRACATDLGRFPILARGVGFPLPEGATVPDGPGQAMGPSFGGPQLEPLAMTAENLLAALRSATTNGDAKAAWMLRLLCRNVG